MLARASLLTPAVRCHAFDNAAMTSDGVDCFCLATLLCPLRSWWELINIWTCASCAGYNLKVGVGIEMMKFVSISIPCR